MHRVVKRTRPLHKGTAWSPPQAVRQRFPVRRMVPRDPMVVPPRQAMTAAPRPMPYGTKYCQDDNTSAVCQSNVTHATPCNGKKCAGGRCGSCSSSNDCRSITYRCRCSDGTEKTGAIDGGCGDSQGSQKWCSHPNIDNSICGANGGLDMSFGYLGTGCISSVDP